MTPGVSEEWCYDTLRRLRWLGGVQCPRCGSAQVTGHSRARRSPRRKYLCKACNRTFTDFTGTPLARTNLPLGTWFLYLRLMGRGERTAELARALGVKWDTAALLERRIAAAMPHSTLLHQLREAAGQRAQGQGPEP